MSAAPAVSEGLVVLEALEESVALAVLEGPGESVVLAVPVVSAIARRNCLRVAVVTIGNTIPNIVVARHIQTGRQQTGLAALLAAIPWRIVRPMRGRTSRNSEAVSKRA